LTGRPLPEEHALASMDITCGDCGTRFRLDVALLQGAKGGRIRCRRCGGQIVVNVPDESPAPPDSGVSDVFRSEPVSSPALPPQETSPPLAVEGTAPAQEWVSPWPVEASAPVPLPQPEAAGPGTDSGRQEAHDPGSAEPVSPEMPGKIYSRLEDLFVPPAMEAGPDRIPTPPEEVPAEEIPAERYPPEETAEPEPRRKDPSRLAPSRSTLLVVSVLCVLLLLAAAALYFGTTKSGREQLGTVFPGWATPPGSITKTPYDIRNVKWSIEKETASGTLFVVTGEVANFGKGASGGIGIRATLIGKDNQALVEKAAFAGNLLDNAALGRMDRPAIEGAMSNRFGAGDVNREIPPGKVLPFMVIFFDPPVEIDAVMVKAIDAR